MIGRLKNYLLQYILDLKFKKKLFITYFFLIIIPLLVFTLITYSNISQIIQNNIIYLAKQSFDQATFSITSRFNSASNISDVIILDSEVVNVFTRMTKSYEIPQQMKDYNYLKKTLINLQRNKDIFHIRLFIPDDLAYSGDLQNIFNLNSINREKWYDELKNRPVNILWYPTTCSIMDRYGEFRNEEVLSALRLVKNPEDYSLDVGVLSVDILKSDINDIINKAVSVTKIGIVYMEESNSIIQSSSSPENTKRWRVQEKYFDTRPERDWQKTTVNGEMAIVGYEKIGNTNWRLVSVTPLNDILSSSISQRNSLILLMLVMGAIAYLLAYFISVSSTKRIYRLIDKMRQVQLGDMNITVKNDSKDEIGELSESFNYMLKEMRVLIEKQIKIGQEVKNAEIKIVQAELKTLQVQINPHFLYNTLDLINWIAIKNNCPDIESLIILLSRFYKLSLSKGKDIVTIGDEMLNIQTYIQIQNYRFDNSIQLELDTDSVCNYKIPKITLQPLVENSITHGIQKKPERVGIIRISGILENDAVILYIQDDGIGMTEEHIQSIFINNNPDEVHGFGIRNTNERLKLYFGNEYGLTYRSMPGMGTTVEIRIPPVE